MQIGIIGANHLSSTLEERETISKAFQRLLDSKARDTVFINTCNRVELYFSSSKLAERHSQILCYLRPYLLGDFEHTLYSYFGSKCFYHLGRVITGVDSAIFGESEIQRQVKLAYEKERKKQMLSSHLHYLFQKGLKIGKDVRTKLLTEQGNIKLAKTLLAIMLQEGLSSRKKTKILFIGNSMVNRALIVFFKENGWNRLTLCTRLIVKDQDLVVAQVGLEKLENWLDYDVIIGATEYAGYLLKPKKSSKKVCLFDLSVPRIFDPKLKNSVHSLYNIDELGRIIQRQNRRGKKELKLSEDIVFQAVERQMYFFKQKELSKWRYAAC